MRGLTIDTLKRDRKALVTELERAGAVVRGDAVKCPFHNDRNPSGSIYKAEGAYLFKCHACDWNNGKDSGDIIAVIQAHESVGFRTACKSAGVDISSETTNRASANRKQHRELENALNRLVVDRGSALDRDEELEQFAGDAHQRLMSDVDALNHLWVTRAIDRDTASKLGLGVIGRTGQRFWTLPIRTDGHTTAVKGHRADDQSQKSWWKPRGSSSDQLWPVNLTPEGPVWLCSGELKAAALIGLGLAAIGITSGEGNTSNPKTLPQGAVDTLSGREVAVVGDDDDVGRAWSTALKTQLTEAGIEARVVDLGLDRACGTKDIGDWMVRQRVEDDKAPESVTATLLDRWDRACRWHGTRLVDRWRQPAMWEPDTWIPSGLASLDNAIGGGFRCSGVHLIAGKAGNCKTQIATNIAINAASEGVPTAFFSLELRAYDIARLGFSLLGRIPRHDLNRGRGCFGKSEALERVGQEHSNSPLSILDDEFWDAPLDRERLAKLIAGGVSRFGWKLVVLDYLGLIAAMPGDRNDYFHLDLMNSAVLKQVAQKHDVALVVVASLRKSSALKSSAEKLFSLDDIAGAGRLAYDAETVLVLNKEHCPGGPDVLEVICLKNRFAPGRDEPIQLEFHGRYGLIKDLSTNMPSAN